MPSKLVTFAMVLAVFSVSCGPVGSQSPGERALEAMELVLEGKPKQLNDYVLKADVSRIGIFYGLMSAAFLDKGGVSQLEVESETINGESSSVKIRWHYKNGGSAHETFPLKREEGKWRLNL